MNRIIKFLENELSYTYAYLSMVEASMNSGFDFVNDIKFKIRKFKLSEEDIKILEKIYSTYLSIKENTIKSKNNIVELKDTIINNIEL